MISPQLGRVAFRIAFFIILVSLVLIFFLEPGSADFGVTSVTLLIGLAFIVLVAFLVRRFSR